MHIHTIEENFEYQMAHCIAGLLKDNDKKPADFEECPDDLMTLLWEERAQFGRIVVERMGEWASEDDWMVALSEVK